MAAREPTDANETPNPAVNTAVNHVTNALVNVAVNAAATPTVPHLTPTCPNCGYDRSGLESASLCPECGAEGLEGTFVLVGQTRFSRTINIVAAALCGLFATTQLVSIVGRIGNPTMRQIGGAMRPNYVDPPPSVGDFVSLAVFAIPFLVLVWQLWIARTAPQRNVVAWTFHPKGIEIRTPGHRSFIRREDVAWIDCADFALSEGSQFLLVPRRSSMRGMIGSTKALYLLGPKELRRAMLRKVREFYPL
jgi:predicted Zn-ribbon and HTH transcriptional regulator